MSILSKGISNSRATQLGWYMDTADSADTQIFTYDASNKKTKLKDVEENILTIIKNIKINPNFNEGFLERWKLTKDKKTFSKFIPLSCIFRFCRDVKKMISGEIKINLEKITYTISMEIINMKLQI